MSTEYAHILGTVGEVLILVGGLVPLKEILNRSHRRSHHEFMQDLSESVTGPTEIQVGSEAPLTVFPSLYHTTKSIQRRHEAEDRGLALVSGLLLSAGAACLIAYHWLSMQ